MMNVKLTPRLSAVASLVKGGGIIADIGTDHGYLPIYLLKNGLIDYAICSDIKKGPLANAEKNSIILSKQTVIAPSYGAP